MLAALEFDFEDAIGGDGRTKNESSTFCLFGLEVSTSSPLDLRRASFSIRKTSSRSTSNEP